MDYFDDAFHTFMDLDSAIYYAANGTSHKPSGFHPKYLKLCSEDWTKLLRVWNDMGVSEYWQIFHFGVEYPFNC